jgi:hypothetical protein
MLYDPSSVNALLEIVNRKGRYLVAAEIAE